MDTSSFFSVQSTIENLMDLSDQLLLLQFSEDFADVIFIVEEQEVKAHKVILAARSHYFRALLFGGLKETFQNIIPLNDISLEAFKILLSYIYSGVINILNAHEAVVIDTLGLAHKYGLKKLEVSLAEVLMKLLSIDNVCHILDMAHLYNLGELVDHCHRFMDIHASDILSLESFTQLSMISLTGILRRDSFYAPEIDIFRAVCSWCTKNTDKVDLIMPYVRFSLMDASEIMFLVKPSKFIEKDVVREIISMQRNSNILPYRGRLVVDENMASLRLGSRVVSRGANNFLIDDSLYYYFNDHYSTHIIEGPNDEGIIVRLGEPSIINFITVVLWYEEIRPYSYFVEVSMNRMDWLRVVDYRKYDCRATQSLYFESKVVQYIKIVGTKSVNNVFSLVLLEAKYKLTVPQLVENLIVPTYNVASLEQKAVVLQGYSRPDNALIDGNNARETSTLNLTFHRIGSGAIIVQLNQPYILSSLSLLLWDKRENSYSSYYIESSINMREWEMVADRRQERCRSWQDIQFSPRPVVYFKIVGTFCSGNNELFYCKHFECPSMHRVERIEE